MFKRGFEVTLIDNEPKTKEVLTLNEFVINPVIKDEFEVAFI